MSHSKGIIYVLTNKKMPGLVKIGKTKRSELEPRLKELYNTSVPLPFDVAFACEVDIQYCDDIEFALHNAFADRRVNDRREFFELSPDRVIPILKLLEKKYEVKTVTEEVSNEIQNDLTDEDKEAQEKVSSKTRRPNLNFTEMGIEIGETLNYLEDRSITVKVVGDKKVSYNDEIMSFTMATRKVKGLPLDYKIQPTPFWTYKEKVLQDIYNETYPFETEDE